MAGLQDRNPAEKGYPQEPTTSANLDKSILPPETTATILPRPAWPLRAAAKAQPAAPSAMMCARSATSFIARATPSSVRTIEPSGGCGSEPIGGSSDFPPAPSANAALHAPKYP